MTTQVCLCKDVIDSDNYAGVPLHECVSACDCASLSVPARGMFHAEVCMYYATIFAYEQTEDVIGSMTLQVCSG